MSSPLGLASAPGMRQSEVWDVWGRQAGAGACRLLLSQQVKQPGPSGGQASWRQQAWWVLGSEEGREASR